MPNEHFKALMRKGQQATQNPREALKHLGSESAAAATQDSIRCPNCSNTLGISKDLLTASNDDVPFFTPGIGVYVTSADPIIDGPQDMDENGGRVIVCSFCGYDVTEPVQNFYGTAVND